MSAATIAQPTIQAANTPVSESNQVNAFNVKRAGQILSTISPENQQHTVLNHILLKGSLSQLEADELYRIKRLTSRITELKARGVKLWAEMRHDVTGTRYARYFIAS